MLNAKRKKKKTSCQEIRNHVYFFPLLSPLRLCSIEKTRATLLSLQGLATRGVRSIPLGLWALVLNLGSDAALG